MLSSDGQHLLGQGCALVGVVLSGVAISQSRSMWRRHQRPQDLALLVLASAWLLHLLVTAALREVVQRQPRWHSDAAYFEHLGLQLLLTSVGIFLLLTAGIGKVWVYGALLVQSLMGQVVLNWLPGEFEATFSSFVDSPIYQPWVALNLEAALGVSVLIFSQTWRTSSTPGWLALTACLLGLGLCADQLLSGNRSTRIIVSHLAYALFLWVLWRITSAGMGPGRLLGAGHPEFEHSANLAMVSDFGPPLDAAAVAVAQERRRIGRDLHDSVGSQLVNILSSLDYGQPRDQPVALALEQCLVDLKMTVDSLDASNDNILDALGRLRYRVQHSLDKLGIRMSWRVEVRDELAAVRGETALHALRIAQESLSNVMVHARATAVEVVCRYLPETGALVLEVRDNGRGIARQSADADSPQRAGRGLQSMRQRALSVGGSLMISSKQGAGTRVRLTLPIAAQLPPNSQPKL